MVTEVRDNGQGVDTGSIDRIFEAFQSAHEVPSQPGSVGLALWVAGTFVQLLGGSLSYIFEHGESVFRFELPMYGPDRRAQMEEIVLH